MYVPRLQILAYSAIVEAHTWTINQKVLYVLIYWRNMIRVQEKNTIVLSYVLANTRVKIKK